ncbi:hypothetical protein ABGB16_32455, partial [Micromonospora sp. B11E3]
MFEQRLETRSQHHLGRVVRHQAVEIAAPVHARHSPGAVGAQVQALTQPLRLGGRRAPLLPRPIRGQDGAGGGTACDLATGSRCTPGNPTAAMRSRSLRLRIRPTNHDIPRAADGTLPQGWLIAEWLADGAEGVSSSPTSGYSARTRWAVCSPPSAPGGSRMSMMATSTGVRSSNSSTDDLVTQNTAAYRDGAVNQLQRCCMVTAAGSARGIWLCMEWVST